jgi:hypothetical protein
MDSVPLWAPPIRTMLVIAPHPDDKILGVGAYGEQIAVTLSRQLVVDYGLVALVGSPGRVHCRENLTVDSGTNA